MELFDQVVQASAGDKVYVASANCSYVHKDYDFMCSKLKNIK